MTGPKNVAFRGIQDCKVAKLTLDSTGSLTYDSLVDIPIKNLTFKPNVETYTAKYDDLEQEVDTVIQSYEVSGGLGRVSLDALALMLGTTVQASGTGATEKQTMSESFTNNPNYFKLETQSTRVWGSDGNAGDIHNVFYKCKITDMDYSISDDFAVVNFKAKAVRTVNSGKIKDTIINKTATNIA